jgi:hypothetical protein
MAELSEYELERLERIRRNEAYMASLGLGKKGKGSQPNMKAAKKATVVRVPKQHQRVADADRRSSSRIAGRPTPVDRLSYDHPEWAVNDTKQRAPRGGGGGSPRSPRIVAQVCVDAEYSA